MKKRIVLFLVTVLLLMSGCSQKKPKSGGSASNGIAGETVTIDEGGVSSRSLYNGSTDGMKSVYFDFGDYDISFESQRTVTFNAGVLNGKLQGRKVKLEGNCDEFGTDEYNYALGLKRAKAVKESLQAQGVRPGQIILVSYGESNPQCREATESCYGRNRRVDLHLVR
ncbi:MAG: OmpA family protein [Campylobacterota bacterium]|nr:OmpA family protein [Campylobacterota bacterium]